MLLLPCYCAAAPWLQVPAFSAFEAMVRVLRVLRVFRIFRLGRRLHSEVQARLLMLACTLAAIIVTAASLFYEIETRFGVSTAVFTERGG